MIAKLYELICKPDKDKFKDPEVNQMIYMRNSVFLTAIFLFVINETFIIPKFAIFSPEARLIKYTMYFCMFISHVLFCRRHPKFVRLLIAISRTFCMIYSASLAGTETFPDAIPNIMVNMHLVPIILLLFDQSYSKFLIAISISVCIVNTNFKSGLLHMTKYMNPEESINAFIMHQNVAMTELFIAYTLVIIQVKKGEEELNRNKKMAQESYSHLKGFLMSFSHELRNPLNSLLGNVSMSLDEPLPSNVYQMISTAKVCGEFLLQFINNILDSGKAELGNIDINPQQIETYDLFKKIWKITSELIKMKKLSGSMCIDNSLPKSLNLDPYRISQIMFNLIGNSVKFTDSGFVKIQVSWLNGAKYSDKIYEPIPFQDNSQEMFNKDINLARLNSNSAAHLKSQNSLSDDSSHLSEIKHGVLKIVAFDSGIGIKEEDQKELFTKFYQAGDVTKRQSGSGLGLSITKELCTRMGGGMKIFSKYEVGTAVMVAIPTYYQPIQNPVIELNKASEILKRSNIKAYLHINEMGLDLLSKHLKKIDAEILQDDGKLFNRTTLNPDHNYILFTDGTQGTGLNLVKTIRKIEKANNLPPLKIIYINVNFEKNLIEQLTSQNGDFNINSVLKAPYSYEELLQNLISTLNTK